MGRCNWSRIRNRNDIQLSGVTIITLLDTHLSDGNIITKLDDKLY